MVRINVDPGFLPEELLAAVREELDATREQFHKEFPAFDWDIAIFGAFLCAAKEASRLAGWRMVAIVSCITNALMLGVMLTKGVL